MTADKVRAAFERYQKMGFMHPLTCCDHRTLDVHATTETSATLKCGKCGWEQHIGKDDPKQWAYLFQMITTLQPDPYPWEHDQEKDGQL